MTPKRRCRLEQLETRQLFASDLSATTSGSSGFADVPAVVADFVAANPDVDDYFRVQNFQSSLLGSFNGFDPLRPVQIGDTIVTVEDNQVRLFAPDTSTNQYSQRSLFSTADRIASVTTFDDKLLIVTSRSNGMQTKFVTNLILAQVDQNHQLQVVDQVARDTKFVQLGTYNGALTINWGMPFIDSSDSTIQSELDKAEVHFIGDPTSFEYTLVDYLPSGSTKLPRQPLLSAQGSAGVMWADATRILVHTYDGSFLIDKASGQSVLLNTGDVDWPTYMSPSGDNWIIEGGMGERYFAPRMQYDKYGTVVLDKSLQVVSTSVDLVGDQARLKFENETYGTMFQNEQSSSVKVYADMYNLHVVTQLAQNQFEEQQIPMPGLRLGFAGAFVVDTDTILSVRAHISEEQMSSTAMPDLALYVLKRDATGKFETTQSIPLEDFDFRAQAFMQTDGTITIQNATQSMIIRMKDDQVSIQTVQAPSMFNYYVGPYRLTGFADIAFYSGMENTVMVTPDMSEAAMPQETFTPLTYPEDQTDASTLIDLLANTTGNNSASSTGAAAITSTATSPANVEPESMDALDVNSDATVTPLDALLIINYLNAHSVTSVVGNEQYDVNGDGELTPLDALTVINKLNEDQAPLPEPEELRRRRNAL